MALKKYDSELKFKYFPNTKLITWMKTSAYGSLILLVLSTNSLYFRLLLTVVKRNIFKVLSTTFQINYNYTIPTLSATSVHNENKAYLFLMLFDLHVLFFYHSLQGCKGGKLKETDVLIIWTHGSLSPLMSTVRRY